MWKWMGALLLFLNLQAAENSLLRNEYQVGATLWMQQSGEYRALALQAYRLAMQILQRELKRPAGEKPLAIITDIDETVLDNSPFSAKSILNHTKFPQGWTDWTDLASANALPGAVNFFQLAASSGVEIFYITNRRINEKKSTLANLHQMQLPVKDENLLLRTDSASKKARKDFVRERYKVLMYLGDNLDDFADDFEQKSVAERKVMVDEMKNSWGEEYVVLPNPTYGSWEGALYRYNYAQSDEALDALRKAQLILPQVDVASKRVAGPSALVYKAHQ